MNRGDTDSNGEIQLHASSQWTPFTLGLPNSSGSGRGSHHSDHQSMYKAAFEGNWEKAEVVLRRDRRLGYQEITETGDRALHVAISMGHTDFVLKLIEWTSSSDQLGLLDGHGYTACCYAAMTGMEEVARKITEQNQNLGTARNGHGTTPLQLAASYGNGEVVLQFLKFPGVQYLSTEEWFDLLLVTIRSKMYDVALNVFEKVNSLAMKTNVDGTALHVLAQLDIRSEWKAGGGKLQNNLPLWAKTLWNNEYRNMQSDPRLQLAEKLWAEIQKLERDDVLKLMKNPPILHDAAKVGNVELITMITHAYPELLWHINSERCTVFHIAVMYRQEGILDLIKQTSIKDLNALSSECVNGNNIVHLAGKLQHPDALKIVSEPDLQMKSELAWFKRVEAIVPPLFLEKRNTDGHKPRELFWMEHKNLFEESMKHLKSTSESCLLVATIILTVVFAAAFAPPGGYDRKGVPILLTNSWFTSFVIFEVLALFSSTYSILTFWSILSSNYEEDQFLSSPNHMRHALSALLFSVLCAISAFLSGFFLVFVQRRKALVVSFMLPVYVWLVVGVSFQFFKLFPKTNLLEYYSRMGASPSKYNCFNDSLWRRGYNFGFRILSSVWKFIRDQFCKGNINSMPVSR
ncbi:hypothetical protein C2S51_018467 [Perilla frutescens var. frutescens]|nr:hypothetical protein C2S51_018467 [Perilla frutescens var. frutescens]